MDSFKDRERVLGITDDNFRKKFIFHDQQTQQAFFFDRYALSPSENDGLTDNEEDGVHILGCRMINQGCILLRLPITTAITAQTIFHFYFQRVSLLRHDFRDIVMGAVFLAGKSEETIRRSAHVALVFDQVFRVRHFGLSQTHERQRHPLRVPDVTSYEFKTMQTRVLDSERQILFQLGFEIYRLQETPHRYINSLFLEFKGHPQHMQIVKVAWSYLNDSYMTRACLYYPGQMIAAACVQLALRRLSLKSPSAPWWCLLEASGSIIQNIMVDILALYGRNDNLQSVQGLLTRAGNAKNIQHVFPDTYFRRLVRLINKKEEQQRQKAPATETIQPVPEPPKQQKTTNVKQTKDRSDDSRSRSRHHKKKDKKKHRSRSRSSRRGKSRDRKKSKKHKYRHSSQESSRDKKRDKHQKHDKQSKHNQKKQVSPKQLSPVRQPQQGTEKPNKDAIMKKIQEQLGARVKKLQISIQPKKQAEVVPAKPDDPADELDPDLKQQLRAKILKRRQMNLTTTPSDDFTFDP